MTTIAWDGRTVAADRQGCSSHMRLSGSYNKLMQVGDTVYAFTGTLPYMQAMVDWHRAGAKPDKLPKSLRDSDNGGGGDLIVFKDGRCFSYTVEIPFADEQFAPAAFGSGFSFAIGALLAGVSAWGAVEVASKLDCYSGGGVTAIDLSFQQNGTREMAPSPKMTAKRRKSLKPAQFGLPDQEKYPLDSPGRARNAKARASEEVHKGNLSVGEEKKIDARADRALSKRGKRKGK